MNKYGGKVISNQSIIQLLSNVFFNFGANYITKGSGGCGEGQRERQQRRRRGIGEPGISRTDLDGLRAMLLEQSWARMTEGRRG